MFEDFSPTNGSNLLSILSCLLIIVTAVPSDHQACAISHPTRPSPIIASELGALFAPVAFLFVHGCASVNPFTFGILALLPVDNTTVCHQCNSIILGTNNYASRCPCPCTIATPAFSSTPFSLLSSTPPTGQQIYRVLKERTRH